MISLEQIREEMLKWDNFIIMGHVDPDGDCIGSLFALKWYLDSTNLPGSTTRNRKTYCIGH